MTQGPPPILHPPAGVARSDRTSTLAIVALIFALLGFGVIAIVLALIAKRQINRTGEHGSNIAFAAFMLGIFSTIATVLIIASFLSAV